MKKSKLLLIALFASLGIMLFQSTVIAAEGNTSLEILPLNEKYPRIYEVNDLDFGTHDLKGDTKNIHPKDDLTIKILDSRVESAAWELQVALSTLTNEGPENSIPSATISLGKGKVVNEEGTQLMPYGIKQTLSDSIYQTVLKSESDSPHGWISYTVSKEDIRLDFRQAKKAGTYQATNNWRFVNAKF